jgi:hypothetical protein
MGRQADDDVQINAQFDRIAEIAATVVALLFAGLGGLELVGILLLADPEHGQPGPRDSIVEHVTFYGLPPLAIVCGLIGVLALPHDRHGIYAAFTLISVIAAVAWLLGG